MSRRIYFDEHINYLREITPGRRSVEITRLFNEKFGLNASVVAVNVLRRKHGIYITLPRSERKYTDAQLAYLKELSHKGLFNKEITEKYNAKFGTNEKAGSIQQTRARYGFTTTARHYFKKGRTPWNKGMKGLQIGGKETQFKPGQNPHNWLPVGSIVEDTDGYLKIKVRDPNKWEHCHRYIWEKRHGRKVPKGHVVLFADSDKSNLDPDNLMLISRAQLATMNKRGLVKSSAELTKTGVIIADVLMRASKRKRGVAK